MQLHSFHEDFIETDGLWSQGINGKECIPFLTVIQHYKCRHCGITCHFPLNIYPIRTGCSGVRPKIAWKSPIYGYKNGNGKYDAQKEKRVDVKNKTYPAKKTRRSKPTTRQ